MESCILPKGYYTTNDPNHFLYLPTTMLQQCAHVECYEMVTLDIYVQNITCSEYHLCIMPIHNCKQDCMCCHQRVRLAQRYFCLSWEVCSLVLYYYTGNSIQYIPSYSI